MRKELGKIQKAYFGFGGYQEAQFGFWLTLGGTAWVVGDGLGGSPMTPTSEWAERKCKDCKNCVDYCACQCHVIRSNMRSYEELKAGGWFHDEL